MSAEASQERLGKREWAQLLAEHFFRPRYAGTHVMFFVDRRLLAQLAGADEDAAALSLARAATSGLRKMVPGVLFEPIAKETRRWRSQGADGPPPCLPLLALTVLAATDMRRDRGRAATNYYDWFYDLLRLAGIAFKDGDVYSSYGDEVPQLWVHLQWWLDEANGGRLGLSTIVEDDHWTRLGFADSQTLFRSSDQDKLSQYFAWLKLAPGEEITTESLVEHFRIWAAKRDDLSLGVWAQLNEGDFPRQLGDLLGAAALGWKGVERDDQGRKLARIAITFAGRPGAALQLNAERPDGFPEQVDLTYAGEALQLESLDADLKGGPADWYARFDISVTAEILAAGLDLAAGGRAFRMRPRRLYVLQRSTSLERWSSVEAIRPYENAWLIVSENLLAEVEGFLAAHSSSEPHTLTNSNLAPVGWRAIRNVVIDPVSGPVPDELRALAPRSGNRLSLRGGLRMPHGQSTYLLGGPPDVELPPDSEATELDLTVDGSSIALGAAGTVRLAGLPLGTGPHAVALGDLNLTFGLVDGEAGAAPAVEGPISWELDGGAARVRGALVEGRWDNRPATPILLPVGPARRVLLGARPGEIEEIPRPIEPRWMAEANLGFRVFEHTPQFPVAWMIVDGAFGLLARQVAELEPRVDEPVESLELVTAWWAAVAEAAERLTDETARASIAALAGAAGAVDG